MYSARSLRRSSSAQLLKLVLLNIHGQTNVHYFNMTLPIIQWKAGTAEPPVFVFHGHVLYSVIGSTFTVLHKYLAKFLFDRDSWACLKERCLPCLQLQQFISNGCWASDHILHVWFARRQQSPGWQQQLMNRCKCLKREYNLFRLKQQQKQQLHFFFLC